MWGNIAPPPSMVAYGCQVLFSIVVEKSEISLTFKKYVLTIKLVFRVFSTPPKAKLKLKCVFISELRFILSINKNSNRELTYN